MRRMNQPRLPITFRRRFYQLSLVCLAVYVLVCLGCASWQRRMIYFPAHFTAEQVDRAAIAARLERWHSPTGQAIGMKRLSARQPAAGRVLIVYGNGSWTVGCAHYVDDIQSVADLDVYLLEYPGYADRPGSPSQASVFQAANEALQSLGTNQPVYLLGESLGSGVAAHLAGTHPSQIAGLILLSPFDRLISVAQQRMPFLPVSLLLVDRFPSEDYLRHYHGPLGIMVDGCDNVVPEKFGRRLYDGYAGPKRLWRFPDGQHVSIREPPAQFWSEVVDFWRTSQLSTIGNQTR